MDPQLVADILRRCATADDATRVPATQALQKMESECGFATALLHLYESSDVDLETRFFAITMAGNVVQRRWPPRSRSVISDGEKALIKGFILRCLSRLDDVPHQPAFFQLLRKVARVQFPAHWPEMCQWWSLRWQSQRPDDEASLEAFHGILKDQAKKGIIADKKAFHEVAPMFIDVLGPTWLKAGAISSKMRYHLDGCMGVLFIYGVGHLREHPRGQDFVNYFVQRVIGQCADDDYGFRNKKKLVKHFGLLIRNHPLAFNENSLFSGLNYVLMLSIQEVDERLRKQCIVALTHSLEQKSLKTNVTFQNWVTSNFDQLMDSAQLAFRRPPEEVEAILTGEQPESALRSSTRFFVEAMGAPQYSKTLAEVISKKFHNARNSSDPLLFETVLALASVSHRALKEHGLGFATVMETLIIPTAALYAETGAMSLLPIAACQVLKRWSIDTPTDSLSQVAEIMFTFLIKGGSTGLRCASLSPLKEFLPRLMDSPNWDQLQVRLVPEIFGLISILDSLPTEIWKCLSLALQIFENVNADEEEGAADLVAVGLRHLWVKYRTVELLTGAILDVLRSLTLLPITAQLSETLASVLFDVFENSSGHIEDQARVCLLGAIRTVPQNRSAPYHRLIPNVIMDARQEDGREREIAVDILIEMAALGFFDTGVVSQLMPLCQQWLETPQGADRPDPAMQDRALRLLLLLMVGATSDIQHIIEALVHHFLQTFNADTAEKYHLPIPALVPVICAFLQRNSQPPATETERYISALGDSLRSFKRPEAKVAVLQTMMALQPQGGLWFFRGINEVLRADGAYTPLQQALIRWTSKTKMPKALRVQHELDKRWNCSTNMRREEVQGWVNQLLCSAFGSVPAGLERAPPEYQGILRERLNLNSDNQQSSLVC
eukprot:GEMP01011554.1.p1 GENE.GEMP01011554.1~~GEMP01011554.1.p1  ORF type:complete len:905 (-),score=155.97 GEMP01011554.1:514-3192(-)